MLGPPFFRYDVFFFTSCVLEQVIDPPQVNFPFLTQDKKDHMALKTLKRYNSSKDIYMVVFSFGIIRVAGK